MRFEGAEVPTLTLTQDWLDHGFIRFHINVTVDLYGNIGGGDQFQVRPTIQPQFMKYQEVRSHFVDRGRGIDEEASTWQEVLVPLKYFTGLRPGQVIRGLNIQTRHQITRAFSLDDVEYVRFDPLPDWMQEQQNQTVKQDWVQWPTSLATDWSR